MVPQRFFAGFVPRKLGEGSFEVRASVAVAWLTKKSKPLQALAALAI